MNEYPAAKRPWHWSRALWKIAVGLTVAWALFHFGVPARLDRWWEANLSRDTLFEKRGHVLLLATLGLPLVLAGMGVLELIFRRPFREIAAGWNSLPEWVQGVLFLLLTLGAAALLFLPIMTSNP